VWEAESHRGHYVSDPSVLAPDDDEVFGEPEGAWHASAFAAARGRPEQAQELEEALVEVLDPGERLRVRAPGARSAPPGPSGLAGIGSEPATRRPGPPLCGRGDPARARTHGSRRPGGRRPGGRRPDRGPPATARAVPVLIGSGASLAGTVDGSATSERGIPANVSRNTKVLVIVARGIGQDGVVTPPGACRRGVAVSDRR